MTDTDNDYGFFCDLENAKIMEYEKVEYYVVKVSTKYEVVARPSGSTPVDIESLTENSYIAKQPDNSVCCICENGKEQNAALSCFYSTFSFLARLPQDVYYSFMVCTMTASCVYIIMTLPDGKSAVV